jgi:hypothetical protein
MLKKKIWANFQRIIELLLKKFSLSSQNYGFWIRDLRSGIRDPEKTIPDPGSRGQKSTGSQIPGPDQQHWFRTLYLREFVKILNGPNRILRSPLIPEIS